ncbi:flagellar biosynthetic protein FliO [Neptuniibacter sp. CAU 1671]|uniref:flagellar biosynthetic protein FliO n=1 Tax=Neptuniibacter sp. CAU 1671 TaxID=3032593 RepID=UPI0023DC1B88|nr:flagellar biosynthetic protein FliO [Neptuniibacter sp. CAU 1671]MDF2181358.1 flagellar biosynthetic protein FliO [Neptuniibacter sp. CAU 1671]
MRPAFQEPFSIAALTQLVFGLGLVLGMILLLAWLVRRFSGFTPMSRQMRVLAVLPLSTREKVVLVEVGGQQLLLGVAPGRVNLIKEFEEPVVKLAEQSAPAFAAKLAEVLQRQKSDG